MVPRIRKITDDVSLGNRTFSWEIYDAENPATVLDSGSATHVDALITNESVAQIFENLLMEYSVSVNFSEGVGTEPTLGLINEDFSKSYVILAGTTITNGVSGQLVTGNTGHVGTLSAPFTYVSGTDVEGATLLGTTAELDTPLGDAHLLYTNLNLLTPTFSYAAGAIDLATDVTTPDGIGVFKVGVYVIDGACNIGAAGITIEGLGNVVFLINGALTSTAASVVTLINGANAENIYWVTVGAVSLGATTVFFGNVLSGPAAITTGANFVFTGRLISESAITLGGGINSYIIPVVVPPLSTVVNVNSSPYNVIQTTGDHTYLVDATAGNITINLPTAIGSIAKLTFIKIDSTANTVIVDGNGAQTVNGDTTATILFRWTAFSIVSNNLNWIRTS